MASENDQQRLLDRIDAVWAWSGARLQRVTDDRLHDPTPCDGFDLGQLLEHLTMSAERFVVTVGGELPAATAAQSTATRLVDLGRANLAAWRTADLDASYDLPLGRLPAPLVAEINVVEVVLHGWDVGRSTGEDADVPDDLAEEVLRIGEALLGDEARGRAFAPALTVPADASWSARAVAFYGRRPGR